MAERLGIDDLGGGDRIDDRWTADKLARAGWTFRGERACRDCGEPVEFWHRDGMHGAQWLVLENTLEPHRC